MNRSQGYYEPAQAVRQPWRGIHGIYLGLVISVNAHTAQVGVEMTDGSQPLDASVMSTNASGGSGLIWLPVIGDLVAVAFLDGNDSQPVVLGSLYASNDTVHSQTPGELALRHSSGTALVVTPDGALTITQAGGSFLVLNADGSIEIKDVNGGADLHLTSSGATLSQAGASVQIQPDGSIHLTPAPGRLIHLGGGTTFLVQDQDVTSSPLGGPVADHYHLVNATPGKVITG